MRQRKDLIEIFSAFLQFEGDRPTLWAIDPRLNRSMTKSIAIEPRGSEDFWATYWLRQYTQHLDATNPARRQPIDHLSAYLQETCFWSVSRVMPRMGSTQMQLSDGFQVAIADVPKLLAAFDASKPSGLKTYANTVFGNTLRDYLRQRREVDFCSEWGLLQKISRKRLLDVLAANNFDRLTRDRYYLAWQALTTNYSPDKSPKLRTLAAPTPEIWQAIEQSYNRSRRDFPHLTAATAKDIEKWLLDAAKKVRSYLYPTVNSLNVKKGEDNDAEWESDLVGNDLEPMAHLEEQETRAERQTQQQQMVEVLQTAIDRLDAPSRQLLNLYYRDRATQQQIAQQLDMPQYTVSRKLSKTRETLLKAILVWGQATLHISPTSDVINSISALLEEWLESVFNR
ncbi:sigma-70 family RNA polymerase sigma factor [Chamaesiphon minutus]|uniref:RNA polymerase sigma factor, sigma-70 family n=1 Tax=Chamaesiphon minutus (strain ATCC 27169 / PCC 6605) TaxID=1173020 RepID=K9UFU6_CHAP6|nr:sigma-70 family RNA polymerase sigma factor [Chamaesiphon minutus]AFY93266.1 RNA polymerase sigma factor, sigma-70 family [Chamaesiphon minutus PCC 6605]